jgi:hypothetical protein
MITTNTYVTNVGSASVEGGSGGMDHEGRAHSQCSGSSTDWLFARMLCDSPAHSRHTSSRTVPSGSWVKVGSKSGASSTYDFSTFGVV